MINRILAKYSIKGKKYLNLKRIIDWQCPYCGYKQRLNLRTLKYPDEEMEMLITCDNCNKVQKMSLHIDIEAIIDYKVEKIDG